VNQGLSFVDANGDNANKMHPLMLRICVLDAGMLLSLPGNGQSGTVLRSFGPILMKHTWRSWSMSSGSLEGYRQV